MSRRSNGKPISESVAATGVGKFGAFAFSYVWIPVFIFTFTLVKIAGLRFHVHKGHRDVLRFVLSSVFTYLCLLDSSVHF